MSTKYFGVQLHLDSMAWSVPSKRQLDISYLFSVLREDSLFALYRNFWLASPSPTQKWWNLCNCSLVSAKNGNVRAEVLAQWLREENCKPKIVWIPASYIGWRCFTLICCNIWPHILFLKMEKSDHYNLVYFISTIAKFSSLFMLDRHQTASTWYR